MDYHPITTKEARALAFSVGRQLPEYGKELCLLRTSDCEQWLRRREFTANPSLWEVATWQPIMGPYPLEIK